MLLIIFILYQILQIIFLPIFIIYLIIRWAKRKPVFGKFSERSGFVPKSPKNKKIIWIHAVSVGEINSIEYLIKKIKKEIPYSFCYLTTGTITGKKTAIEKNLADKVSFLPFDFLIPMIIAYKRINPNFIINIEAEIWPNFLILSKYFKVPVYSLNARISARSKNRYFKLRFILKPIFNIFQKIFVQTEEDRNNFLKLNMPKDKLIVLGNIKAFNYLEKKKDSQNFYKKIEDFKILLVGSIHPGELDYYLNLYKNLKIKHQNLKLILAPRHFNWQHELINKINKLNTKYFLWTDKNNIDKNNIDKNNIFNNYDILLVCKLGELFNLYNMANIYYLGGTFIPVGGHNLLESAVWSKINIIGPYYQNCKDIADNLEKNKGLIKVNDYKELETNTDILLSNPEKIILMGQNSYNWVINQADLVEKNLEILVKLL